MGVYYTGKGDICPVCGAIIKLPHTGEVTSEQIEKDMNCCQWMEVCDEGDGCLGYTPNCHNAHPYTKEEENHKFIHYDLLELLNSSKTLSIENKLDIISKLVSVCYGKDNSRFYTVIVSPEGKLEGINWLNNIEEMTLTLSLDKQGNITLE